MNPRTTLVSIVPELTVINGNNIANSVNKTKEMEQHSKKKRRNTVCYLYEEEIGDAKVVAKYKQLIKFIFLPATMLGIRLHYNWKPHRHFMLWFTLGSLAFAWMCFLFTQYVHIRDGNSMKTLEVFAVYGIGLSCVFKSGNYIKKFKKVQALVEFMLKICRQNSTGRRADILMEHFTKCSSFLTMFTVCIVANLSLYISVPFVSYLTKKELLSLVPVVIPFIDQSTMYGYLLANSLMSINGVLACSGTVFCCTTYILLMYNFTIQVELIGDDFNCLDRMWACTEQSLNEKRVFLRNICLRCLDISSYIADVKDIFDLQMFAFFCGAYFSQIICLFEIAKNNWIPGYAIALLLFEEIMYYCYIGTQKNTTNQKLCSLICDTTWYEYDIQSQQMLKMLLHSCQNSSELKIGPLAPMNLTTGVEIVKSIYTYYTILTELL